MDVFELELESYSLAIEQLKGEINDIVDNHQELNLTHAGLQVSNKANFLAVGLFSLGEARLMDILNDMSMDRTKCEIEDNANIDQLKEAIREESSHTWDFSGMPNWCKFRALEKLRNRIVHGYGGKYLSKADSRKLENALKNLGLEDVLFGGRIRIQPDHLQTIHRVMSDLILDDLHIS